MKLRAGGLLFNVLDTGSGEPSLLFLHYWGGSARTWSAVTQQLSADFRCIAYDISAEVGKIAVPTLVLAGDQDRQDPIEQHKREVLPRIQGAELKIITDCGHLMPIDQPAQLAEAICAFVLN
jgi:pimeloyl-ACP methyl ester carboxylesterase